MKIKLFLLCIFLELSLFHPSTLLSTDREIECIQTAIKSLKTGSSFAFFNLNFSQEEIMALKRLEIKFPQEYNNFSDLKVLGHEVREYIRSLGNQDEKVIETVAKTIERLVNDCLHASGKDTAWISLRAFQPNSHFSIPRWHVDGYYYQPYIDQYKFAFSLKGDSTLFYKLPLPMRESFLTLLSNNNREALAEMLNDGQLIKKAEPHQGAVFRVGSEDAAVHSEPSINEERLFMSILPGSKEQINEWKERGFKKY